MRYALLAACFLLVAVALTASLIRMSVRASRRGPSWPAVGLAAVALVVLTAVFDTIMIAVGFFRYEGAHVLGIRIGLAPLEDFAYPLAGVILLPALWVALRTRRRRKGPDV